MAASENRPCRWWRSRRGRFYRPGRGTLRYPEWKDLLQSRV